MPPFDDIPGLDRSRTELLVKARDSSGGPRSYNRGDIVIARPGGWPWGTQEDPQDPRNRNPEEFVIITVPDRPFKDSRGLGAPLSDEEGRPVAKSRYQVDLDRLPTRFPNWSHLKGFLVDKGGS